MSLHILIAEGDVNAALTTAQLLMNNGHQVETCNDGVHALQYVQRRAGEGNPYHVLIVAYRLAGMDAIRLFTELRMNNLTPEFAMCTQAGQLNPQLRTEALKLGCKTFFDYPIPLNDLNDFVNGVAHAAAQDQSGPFFGTSKFARSEREPSSGYNAITPQTNSYQHPQSDSFNRQTGYNRQSSGSFHMMPGSQSTKRVRRGATGSFTEDQSQQGAAQQTPQDPFEAAAQQAQQQQAQLPPAPPQQAPSQQIPQQQAPPLPPQSSQYRPQTSEFTNVSSTQRIRRSTTGSFSQGTQQFQNPQPAEQPQTAATYKVACAHCGQAFVVQEKAEEYNAMCIHCSGLNRIVPRR